MKTMTEKEYQAETKRLERLIAQADAGKKAPNKSLAEKVACNRERNQLQEALRQHRLNYFELVPARAA